MNAPGGNQPPVALAQGSPPSGPAPLGVTFTSTGSNDPDGTITSYAWDYGDSTTGTGAAPSHTYTTAGSYTATLTVTDNNGATAQAQVDITVGLTLPPGTTTIVETRIAASTDDAEQKSSGTIELTSGDLDIGNSRTVGLRFPLLHVPQGATIVAAYIQFTTDEAGSQATTVSIQGEASNAAQPFTSSSGNVTTRPRTAAMVAWTPVAWPTAGVAGEAQRTPDLTAIVQEVVNRPGWASGNAIGFIIERGTGARSARAYNGGAATAPLLHVEYAQ